MTARAILPHTMRLPVAAAALVLAFPAFAQTSNPANTGPSASPARALPDFTPLVQRYGGAVVNVVATHIQEQVAEQDPNAGPPGSGQELPPEVQDFLRRFGAEPSQRPPVERGEGSGFIVSEDGYVLSNAHVVEGASDVIVRLPDRREFTAKVVGTDPRTDVAVLKIDARDLPTVKMGDSAKLRTGEWVIAIGSPFGLENSVTAGVVSAKSRALGAENGIVPFIQTDVAVNPGNSGGPLFNLQGEVVGINSMIFSGTGGYQGVSFAIPIDAALDVQQQLVKTGRVVRGRIGVAVQDVDAKLAESFGLDRPRGALVSSIEDDSPAAKAGLKPGDVIVSAQGNDIEQASELPGIISHLRPGTRTTLSVVRENKTRQFDLQVDELKEERPAPAVARATPGEPSDPSQLGLGVRPLSPEEKRVVEEPNGLVVEHVSGASAAAGLEAGDIILRAGGSPVGSVKDLQNATRRSRGTIALLVQRQDQRIYVPVRASGKRVG